MASVQHIIALFFFSSLVAFTLANDNHHSHPDRSESLVVVQGLVYCQSCKQARTWSLTDAVPLPGAKVGVSCKDYKRRVMFYRAFQADSHGYLYAPLEGLDLKSYRMDDPIHACRVHLISSPNPQCNTLTNINAGIHGAVLHFEKKLFEGKAALYSSGPLAFRPTFCLLVGHGN